MARTTRRLRAATAGALLGAVVLAGTALSACSDTSHTLGAQACADVARADHYLAQASSTSGAPAKALESRATQQLETAGPIATQAAAGDGTWQALQATLGEVDRVPDAALMPALKADCSYQGIKV